MRPGRRLLIDRGDLTGAVNLAAPGPLPQRAFLRDLRGAWHRPVGLPATRWMAEVGAFALRSYTELLLKGRRVVPGRLLDAGFDFTHPHWPEAARDPARRRRSATTPRRTAPGLIHRAPRRHRLRMGKHRVTPCVHWFTPSLRSLPQPGSRRGTSLSTPAHRTLTHPSATGVRPVSRRRSPSGLTTSRERALLDIQRTAGNRAAVTVMRSGGNETTGTTGTTEDAGNTGTTGSTGNTGGAATTAGTSEESKKKKSFHDRVAHALERAQQSLAQLDNWVSNVHSPINAGFLNKAYVTNDAGLRQDVAASGAGAVVAGTAAEAFETVVAGMEAHEARKEAKKHGKGAEFHTANKKAKSTAADSGIGAAGTVSEALLIARQAARIEEAMSVARPVGTVAGATGGATGLVIGGRAAVRTVTTDRKRRKLKNVAMPAEPGEEAIGELRQALMNAGEATAEAHAALDMYVADPGDTPLARFEMAIDAAFETTQPLTEAATALKQEMDKKGLNEAHKYALKKQRNKEVKQGLTAVGQTTRAAGAIATATSIGMGGALLTSPVGWALAGSAALILFGVAGYKGGRAAKMRYDHARHPERYPQPPQKAEEAAESKDAKSEAPNKPMSRSEAIREALKFWKKVENGERTAMARRLYQFAAGPSVNGQSGVTEDLRATAREILVILKAGPADHRMDREDWEESLNDPEKSEAWIKEIESALSSA